MEGSYSDDEYIAGVQRGDHTVYTALVRAYFEPLTRFAYGMTGALDTAKDIVQDVFVAVWRLGDAWDPKGSIAAYLFTAVRRRALNSAKASAARQRMQEVLRRQADGGETEQVHNADAALLAVVRNELQMLTSRQRDALRLRYEQEMTMVQVAAVLGIDIRAAKKLVARSLASLRTKLAALRTDFE